MRPDDVLHDGERESGPVGRRLHRPVGPAAWRRVQLEGDGMAWLARAARLLRGARLLDQARHER